MKTYYFFIFLILFTFQSLKLRSGKISELKKFAESEIENLSSDTIDKLKGLNEEQLKAVEDYCQIKTKKDRKTFLRRNPRHLDMITGLFAGAIGGLIVTRLFNEVRLFIEIRRLRKLKIEKIKELTREEQKSSVSRTSFEDRINELFDKEDNYASKVSSLIKIQQQKSQKY